MNNYEFAGGLYRNAREMCTAIAEHWLSADGCNGREDMLGFLADETDERLADETIRLWFSDEGINDEKPSVDRDELVEAFARIRSNFDWHFPASENAE